MQGEPMISRASAAPSVGPPPEGSDVSPVVINARNVELTTYLDSEIGSPEARRSGDGEQETEAAAGAADEEVPQVQVAESSEREVVRNLQNEMNINSDLTTLNIDGDNSSSDGGAPYHQLMKRREGTAEDELLVRDEEAEQGVES